MGDFKVCSYDRCYRDILCMRVTHSEAFFQAAIVCYVLALSVTSVDLKIVKLPW